VGSLISRSVAAKFSSRHVWRRYAPQRVAEWCATSAWQRRSGSTLNETGVLNADLYCCCLSPGIGQATTSCNHAGIGKVRITSSDCKQVHAASCERSRGTSHVANCQRTRVKLRVMQKPITGATLRRIGRLARKHSSQS